MHCQHLGQSGVPGALGGVLRPFPARRRQHLRRSTALGPTVPASSTSKGVDGLGIPASGGGRGVGAATPTSDPEGLVFSEASSPRSSPAEQASES